jgi:hypothetical protein
MIITPDVPQNIKEEIKEETRYIKIKKIWAEDNKDGKLGAVFRFSLPTSNNNK